MVLSVTHMASAIPAAPNVSLKHPVSSGVSFLKSSGGWAVAIAAATVGFGIYKVVLAPLLAKVPLIGSASAAGGPVAAAFDQFGTRVGA